MTTSYDHPLLKRLITIRTLRVRIATLILFSIILIAAGVGVAWFNGEGTISMVFAQIDYLQKNPPMWLEVPMMMGTFLFAPTIILLVVVLTIINISPRPQGWSRFVVITILLGLTIRYLTWRSLSTLNLSNPLNGVFSLGLFFFELLMLISGIIQLLLMFNVKNRHKEADEMSIAVINGDYQPKVDILIPTYNEDAAILTRTIVGCQALEYGNKTVYLLDDTRRPQIKTLAEELGCEYITRADNRHAKAGNLNHALMKTMGELIVVFDADFVPTKNFLTRTVGFFQNEKIALVQTPQSFYNYDPIARNLGAEEILTPEEEVFYRQLQPVKDASGSAICSGTSFVVRRSALEEAGFFVTNSLSEDYFTGIRLTAKGYKLIYLDEKLSAGLAAENIAAHATQRIRWAQGTLQAFFIDHNPLTIKGLSLIQRLANLEGLLHWFTSWSKVFFLLIPLAYAYLQVIPITASPNEIIYFFLPYYLVSLLSFSWLNYRSRSAILSDIYSVILCFPLALTVLRVMIKPFGRGFKVTPKGTTNKNYIFNWTLAWPLVILFVFNAISLWRNLGMCLMYGWGSSATNYLHDTMKGLDLGFIWSVYNLIILGITLLVLIDVPKTDNYDWFKLRRVVELKWDNESLWGFTNIISQNGAIIFLTQLPKFNLGGDPVKVNLEIQEESLELTAEVVDISRENDFPMVRLMFTDMSREQERGLIEMLFCRSGQWKSAQSPGELKSILLLFKILLRPRILFDRSDEIVAINVAQV